jgi:hypothetical protein
MRRCTSLASVIVTLLLSGCGFGDAPIDGLDCPSDERTETTVEAGSARGHARAADAEIERSDLWKFLDIRRSAWQLIDDVDGEPDNGLAPSGALVSRTGSSQYLAYVDGQAVLRVNVEPIGQGRYFVAEYTTC